MEQAISGGKIVYQGQRAKASQRLELGAELIIKQGPYKKIVVIKALSSTRRGAKEASVLYEETQASQEARSKQAEQQRLISPKPNKKQRRHIIRFNSIRL
jgi:ribosome-associated heat shock protein Hsp15